MTHPIRHLMGNLIWTRYGTVWAVWRVEPSAYRNAGGSAGMELLDRTEALIRSLPTESLILSLCPVLDRDALADRMQRAYPDRPRWLELCDAAADSLAPYELSQRTHWLAIPLPRSSLRERWSESARASWSRVATSLGLPPLPVTAQEAEQMRGVAVQLQHTLPGLDVRPATPAEILWMFRRAPCRGLIEPTLSEGESGSSRVSGGVLRGPSLAGLDEVRLDEGGKAGRGLVSPLSHRFLAVESAALPGQNSFQAFLAVAEVPAAFVFPGGELLDRLDDFGFGIDWAVRLTVLPRDAAEAQNRKRARELSEQVVQREDASGGMPSDLEQAHRDLDDLRARLSASASEVEVQACMTLCVWSPEQELVDRYADTLRRELATSDYEAVRVTGGQTDLYKAMLPGYPTPRILKDFTQYFLSRDFAMLVPFAETESGDPVGGLLGIRVDSAGAAPVLVDPAYGPRSLHASGSAGLTGELGSGKSVCMKRLLDIVVRSGGLGIVVDRTPSLEWAKFARALPGRSQVLDVSAEARFSLDPLRVFPKERAQRYAEGFVALLLGIEPLSSQGAVLSEAVGSALMSRSPSMATLLRVLEQEHGDEVVDDLRRRLAAAQRMDLAAAVFDPDLPILELADADALVFTTHAIGLPDKEELASEQLIRQLSPEKRMGRAVMYLVAAICRERAFDVDRFAGVFLDECYWLTSSVEGERLALEIIRDGRKHNAAGYFAGHAPSDIGNEVLRGLLGQRFLFRHRSEDMASQGLRWLGLEPEPDLIDLVTKGLSPVGMGAARQAERAGECLYRDCRGRVAKVKVLVPDLPHMAEAIRTDPGGEM